MIVASGAHMPRRAPTRPTVPQHTPTCPSTPPPAPAHPHLPQHTPTRPTYPNRHAGRMSLTHGCDNVMAIAGRSSRSWNLGGGGGEGNGADGEGGALAALFQGTPYPVYDD
jgi:hypothetical protein